MNITIELIGGPCDGEHHTVPDDVAASTAELRVLFPCGCPAVPVPHAITYVYVRDPKHPARFVLQKDPGETRQRTPPTALWTARRLGLLARWGNPLPLFRPRSPLRPGPCRRSQSPTALEAISAPIGLRGISR